ncbi:hypothetical protein CHS0354_003658 [Potamilus streckersoni]|uniref:Uncharacterized protein n=1 Tax=Potamilus streckersoni TaxID=2493646 RepID=A0AAE0S8X5_9BIVA|nr:hypothetical protein CHS0354_003658 [Potamilus streckersoni]
MKGRLSKALFHSKKMDGLSSANVYVHNYKLDIHDMREEENERGKQPWEKRRDGDGTTAAETKEQWDLIYGIAI